MNYQTAKDTIKNRDSKKLGNNTYLLPAGDAFAVRLHQTDVVLIHADGTYTLNSGGWQTPTTKDRINEYTPARLHQAKGLWYNRDGSLFYDGMTIDAAGHPLQPRRADDTEKIKRQVDREVSAYIKGFIQDAKENGLKDPSSGDCWFCSMRTADGKTMGAGDVHHIIEHFKEKYYVPSLLWNALQHRGNPGFVWSCFKTRPEGFRTDLQRYFRDLKPQLIKYYQEATGPAPAETT